MEVKLPSMDIRVWDLAKGTTVLNWLSPDPGAFGFAFMPGDKGISWIVHRKGVMKRIQINPDSSTSPLPDIPDETEPPNSPNNQLPYTVNDDNSVVDAHNRVIFQVPAYLKG